MTTKQEEILHDEKYIACLDHGFVGLVDHMGSDSSIVQSARVSYGSGTKSVREDRGLIRYLMRHEHWTPFEMVEFKFHIKLPIFVARQWLRHRTANVNEYSGRYSVMSDEFYIPERSQLMHQSKTNNQGRSGALDEVSKDGVIWLLEANSRHSYNTYKTLLGHTEGFYDESGRDEGPIYDAYDPSSPLLTDEFVENEGLARELARTVLPVSNYTEMYFKQDLRNLLHLIRLRSDSHAQYEIQVFANAIFELINKLVPLSIEAWEDYVRDAKTLSRMQHNLLLDLLDDAAKEKLNRIIDDGDLSKYDLTKRELNDFKTLLNW